MSNSIFPNIDIALTTGTSASPNTVDGIVGVRFVTLVRKKHRGKYYLQTVARYFDYPNPTSIMTVLKDQNLFLRDVYTAIVLGKVDTKLRILVFGKPTPLFELDTDQRTEVERLIY